MNDAQGNPVRIGDRVRIIDDDQWTDTYDGVGVVIEFRDDEALVDNPNWLGWFMSHEIQHAAAKEDGATC